MLRQNAVKAVSVDLTQCWVKYFFSPSESWLINANSPEAFSPLCRLTVGTKNRDCFLVRSMRCRDFSVSVLFPVAIASQYRISKYPTLKLFRNGQMVKKEYRGQRSADALANFIREELKDPVIEHNSLDELDELDV